MGTVTDRFDIRKPIELEVDFEVIKAGHVFVPVFNLYNEEDVTVFIAHDRDPTWQRKFRPMGRYVSTARIPGNFLRGRVMTVASLMMTEDPFRSMPMRPSHRVSVSMMKRRWRFSTR